jgi:hypothetical protein
MTETYTFSEEAIEVAQKNMRRYAELETELQKKQLERLLRPELMVDNHANPQGKQATKEQIEEFNELPFDPSSVFWMNQYCRRRCADCDYAITEVAKEDEVEVYKKFFISADEQLEKLPGSTFPIKSAYGGGGTFNNIPPYQFAEHLIKFSDKFNIQELQSFTAEGSPSGFTKEYMDNFCKFIVPLLPPKCELRFAIGGFGYDVKNRPGEKEYGATEAIRTILEKIPDAVINVDLVYGSIDNDINDQKKRIRDAMDAGAKSFTLYGLRNSPRNQALLDQYVMEYVELTRHISELAKARGSQIQMGPDTLGGSWQIVVKSEETRDSKEISEASTLEGVNYLEYRWKRLHQNLLGLWAGAYSSGIIGDYNHRVTSSRIKEFLENSFKPSKHQVLPKDISTILFNGHSTGGEFNFGLIPEKEILTPKEARLKAFHDTMRDLGYEAQHNIIDTTGNLNLAVRERTMHEAMLAMRS